MRRDHSPPNAPVQLADGLHHATVPSLERAAGRHGKCFWLQPLWFPSFAGYHQNHAEAVRAGRLRCEHYCRLGVSPESRYLSHAQFWL